MNAQNNKPNNDEIQSREFNKNTSNANNLYTNMQDDSIEIKYAITNSELNAILFSITRFEDLLNNNI